MWERRWVSHNPSGNTRFWYSICWEAKWMQTFYYPLLLDIISLRCTHLSVVTYCLMLYGAMKYLQLIVPSQNKTRSTDSGDKCNICNRIYSKGNSADDWVTVLSRCWFSPFETQRSWNDQVHVFSICNQSTFYSLFPINETNKMREHF